MSSDKSQTQVGGTIAAIGQVGATEGTPSVSAQRVAFQEATVDARRLDGYDRDTAIHAGVYRSKSDAELKTMAKDLLEEMRNNPQIQSKSGTDWAQKNLAMAGLTQELQKMIEGTPVVEERQCHTNIKHLLAAKSLTEMTPLQVQFLQQNLARVGLFKGKIDGDFANTALVAGLDALATSEKAIEKSMKGGIASLDFVWALRNRTAQTSETPSGEKKIMALFKADAAVATAPAQTSAAPRLTDPRLQPTPV